MVSGAQYVAALVLLTAAAVGGLVALETFATDRGTTTEESLPRGAEPVADGNFEAAAGYEVTGTVTLFRDDRGYGLFFEGYTQSGCEEAQLYLTPDPDPSSAAAVKAGRRIPVGGGDDGGELSAEGTFLVRVPGNATVEEYSGVAVWCAPAAELVGSAALQRLEDAGGAPPATGTANRTATANATANGTTTSTPAPNGSA